MAADLVSSFLDRYRLAAVVQALEEDLRGFIRRYVAPYVDAGTIFGERLAELERRAVADGLTDSTVETLVDYIDFGDSFATLNAHRGMIPQPLAEIVRSLTPAFQLAVPIRNRVMHGRPLQEGDEQHIAQLGQTIADSDFEFRLTRSVASRLVSEPDWIPFVEITSAPYGQVLHNLPLPEYDETGLLGRDTELRELKRLLTTPRFPVITIAGEGGIGKTALAVQALYELVDNRDAPYEAVLWVSLKTERLTGRGIEQIRESAFDFLSLTNELSVAVAGAENDDVELLASALASTPTLIAIDNVESIAPEDVRRLIDALPEARFLLTSRVGLGEMEVRIALGALGQQSSKIMLRQLARRRALPQLAKASDKQAAQIVEALRRSPLAIRWFVEAVEAGGQPEELLRDQSSVLQFCMSTIYDALSPGAHRILECLLALERPATIGELALLAEVERGEVQENVYELQRRSLIVVDSKLAENLTQSYTLADMAREHLRRFGSVDPVFGDEIREKLRQIARVDQVMKQHDNRLALEPAALIAERDEELAVAQLLRRALGRSRVGDVDGARNLVSRARDAVPGYFESYRVGGLIESDARPEEARRLYEEAYRLAPDESKARVAYWLAGHLAKSTVSIDEAERYALEAHETLALPGTALRLGRIQMYQHRFDEAEALLLAAANDGVGKARLIAQTDLVNLAKRRVEHLAESEHQPGAALDLVVAAIARADTFLGAGFSDRRFNDIFTELLAEGLLVALRAPNFAELQLQLVPILEALDRHFAIVANPGRRALWEGRIAWLAERPGLINDLRSYAAKLISRLDLHAAKAGEGLVAGEISAYSGEKRYGFIQTREGKSLFFHRDHVVDPSDCVFLSRGVEVAFRVRHVTRNGEPSQRAESVTVTIPVRQRERALANRRGVVATRAETYLFVDDALTHERFYVHRSTLQNATDWIDAVPGRIINFDLEFAPQGPRAVRGSVTLEPDNA